MSWRSLDSEFDALCRAGNLLKVDFVHLSFFSYCRFTSAKQGKTCLTCEPLFSSSINRLDSLAVMSEPHDNGATPVIARHPMGHPDRGALSSDRSAAAARPTSEVATSVRDNTQLVISNQPSHHLGLLMMEL